MSSEGTTDQLPPPPVPPECDLRGRVYLPLDIGWLLTSDFALLSTGEAFKAGFSLLGRAWLSVPAASLPNDDAELARLAGVPRRRWVVIRDSVLREWVLCSDGRFYHPLLAEKALRASEVRCWRLPYEGRAMDVSPAEWRKLRAEVLKRDGYVCRYCGATDRPLQCDHVIPVTRGGMSRPENLAASCAPCNASKGAKTLREWRGRA